jgi:hypothetical protein
MNEHEQRIADLEHELKIKDKRIAELKNELDNANDLVRRFEELARDRDAYLENFITTFGLELNDSGEWENGECIRDQKRTVGAYRDLVIRYNKLVSIWNRSTASSRPVGRPLAASDAQQAQIIKHRKDGKSERWIAEEMTLSRRTVTTVINRHSTKDRTTAQHRRKLAIEPSVKDWRVAARDRLPKEATKLFRKSGELLKEAKGLK